MVDAIEDCDRGYGYNTQFPGDFPENTVTISRLVLLEGHRIGLGSKTLDRAADVTRTG